VSGDRIFALAFTLSITGHVLIFASSGIGPFQPERNHEKETTFTFETREYKELPNRYIVGEKKKIARAELKKQNPDDMGLDPVNENYDTLNPDDAMMLRFHEMIKQHIERHRVYPPSAKKRRIEGTVCLGFCLTVSGHIQKITLIRSSGFEILDRAAVQTLNAAAPFPSFGEFCAQPRISMNVEILYKL